MLVLRFFVVFLLLLFSHTLQRPNLYIRWRSFHFQRHMPAGGRLLTCILGVSTTYSAYCLKVQLFRFELYLGAALKILPRYKPRKHHFFPRWIPGCSRLDHGKQMIFSQRAYKYSAMDFISRCCKTQQEAKHELLELGVYLYSIYCI